MHKLLIRFLNTLRLSGVRISVAEELDAMLVTELVGYKDRNLLRDALGLTVAKSIEENNIYEACFDDFFKRAAVVDKKTTESNNDTDIGENIESATSLGKMLLADDRAGLMLAMELAANEVNLSQIRQFFQMNLYTQRILEQMGIDSIQGEIRAMRGIGTPNMSQQANQLEAALEDLREDVRELVQRLFKVFAAGEPEITIKKKLS